MAESSSKPTIKVQSSDGEVFDVDQDVIKLSNTINTMLQGLWLLYISSCMLAALNSKARKEFGWLTNDPWVLCILE